MLTQEPADSLSRPTRPSPARRSPLISAMLVLAVLLVIFLRHDYWNWDSPRPLLLGFLPVGLWWQGLVSILASLMMWLLVTFAWPDEVEAQAMKAEQARKHEH